MIESEFVILVDEHNQEVGLMEKREAHEKALLHRAFSVFIFNDRNELLLQQRAKNKYHSGGLWTNTCCSHPRFNESTIDAAHRRLKEEMGFDAILSEQFSFIYQSDYENGLSEHELDFVYCGYFNGTPHINPAEVAGFKWMTLEALKRDVIDKASLYTSWFQIILQKYLDRIES